MLSSILQAAILLLLARELSTRDFGIFAVGLTAGGFLAVVLSFGTGALALRVQRTRNPEMISRGILTVRTVILMPALLGGSLVAASISPSDSWVIAAAGAGLVQETTAQAQESVLFGNRRIAAAQVLMLVRRITVTIITSGAWLLDVAPILPSFVLANVIATMLMYATRGTKAFSLSAVKPTLQEGIPFWAPTMLAKLETLDVAAASVGVSGQGLGNYSLVNRLGSPLQLLPGALLSVSAPHLSSLDLDSERRLVVRRSVIYMIIPFGLLLIASPAIGRLMEQAVGGDYHDLPPLLAAFVLGILLKSLSECIIAYFYALGHTAPVRRARLIGVPAGLGSIMLLSGVYGAVGAGLGFALMHLFVLVFLALSFLSYRPLVR